MGKRIKPGRIPVVDGGKTLVRTVGEFFVQDGPTDLDRVRFKPGDKLYVTDKLEKHLVGGNAVEVMKKPRPKKDKAHRPEEDKGAG